MSRIDICFEIPLPPKGITRPTPSPIPLSKESPRAAHANVFMRTAKGAMLPCRCGLHTTKETLQWQTQLAELAEKHMPAGQIDEPLALTVVAVLQRPQRLERKKDPDGFIEAPTFPDWDNVGKNACDALKAFWRNDTCIVDGRVIKAYAERGARPRVFIVMRSLEEVNFDALVRSMVPLLGDTAVTPTAPAQTPPVESQPELDLFDKLAAARGAR